MHFFEKQRVDQIGIMSVALQKVLILLMIVNVFSLFNVGGFLSFLLCIIGFLGAVKRKPCLLMIYYLVSVITMILGFMYVVGAIFYMQDQYYYVSGSESSSLSLSHSSASISESAFSPVPHSFKSAMRRLFSSESSAAPSDPNQSSLSNWSSDSSVASDETSNYMFTFLWLVLGFFLLYMKIFSLVLANRLRKMIKAGPLLPTEHTEEPRDESYPEDENTNNGEYAMQYAQPMPMPMPAPFFNQPGYMPFTPIPMPNMQQYTPGSPAMVPPPMMYGQYPVYYSFAPIPQQEQQTPAASTPESKL